MDRGESPSTLFGSRRAIFQPRVSMCWSMPAISPELDTSAAFTALEPHVDREDQAVGHPRYITSCLRHHSIGGCPCDVAAWLKFARSD